MKHWVCAGVMALGLVAAGCASTGSQENTKRDAVKGGLLGAAAGAVIGHQSGRGLEGAAVGGAAGAAAGGVWGSSKDEAESKQPEPVY